MKSYVKSFFHRGMLFGGFGPIVAGIVFFILSLTLENFSLTGTEVFLSIVSTYLLAFIHAGASIFNQIEEWPLAKSLLCHFTSLYFAYVICYLVNAWIPFEPMVLLIFTAIFVVVYFVIWMIVYLSVRASSKKMNQKLS